MLHEKKKCILNTIEGSKFKATIKIKLVSYYSNFFHGVTRMVDIEREIAARKVLDCYVLIKL